MRQNLLGLSQETFANKIKECIPRMESYRCDQIFTEIYRKGIKDIRKFSCISKSDQEALMEHFFLDFGRLEPKVEKSTKNVFCYESRVGHNLMETANVVNGTDEQVAWISSRRSHSIFDGILPISSKTFNDQIVYDLKAEHLCAQFLLLSRLSGKKPASLVFTGGDPLLNYSSLHNCLKIITSKSGIGFRESKISVLTYDNSSNIEPLFDEFKDVNLRIGLHSVKDSKRLALLGCSTPLREILKACQNVIVSSQKEKKIVFEYALIKGYNDSADDARETATLLSGELGNSAIVNVIPFHSLPGSYARNEKSHANDFKHKLERIGLQNTAMYRLLLKK